MIIENTIQGKYIQLKSAALDDAEFIVNIRNDETKNTYIHKVPKDIELQKKWLDRQMNADGDYYFVIQDLNGKPLGLCSIYNVSPLDKTAEFGRWISWGSAIHNVESVILSFDFAFENLEVDLIYMKIMLQNKAVRNFWKRFGADTICEVFENDLCLEKKAVEKKRYYDELKPKNLKLLRY